MIALAIVLALVLPRAAAADAITRSDPAGDLTMTSGLTAKEKAALDIASVEAVGEESFGLVVKVTFRGNIEKALGHGHLRQGAVALLLAPKSSAQSSSGLIASGPGSVGTVFRDTGSPQAGVIRTGKTMTFFIFGPGLSNVGEIAVKAFARVSPLPARLPTGVIDPVQQLLSKAASDDLDLVLTDLETFPDPVSCSWLLDLRDDVLDDLDRVRFLKEGLEKQKRKTPLEKQQLRRLRSYETYLENGLDQLEDIIAARCGHILFATFVWSIFGPPNLGELMGTGIFSDNPVPARVPAGAASALDAVRVVLADRQVTNFLCPSQLPVGAISTTATTNDTLTCSGGTLPLDQKFQLNVRMSPGPTTGMGGKLFGRQDGVFKGPFQISGP